MYRHAYMCMCVKKKKKIDLPKAFWAALGALLFIVFSKSKVRLMGTALTQDRILLRILFLSFSDNFSGPFLDKRMASAQFLCLSLFALFIFYSLLGSDVYSVLWRAVELLRAVCSSWYSLLGRNGFMGWDRDRYIKQENNLNFFCHYLTRSHNLI